MFTSKGLQLIYNKTEGHCHFCGDLVFLEKYGQVGVDGSWEADHVFQRAKGGSKDASNCLAACTECNRLRWHREGKEIREILRFGIIARNEIKKKSVLGRAIEPLLQKRLEANIKRRRKPFSVDKYE